MKDSEVSEHRDFVMKALEMNWTHARHIETQRMRLLTIYMLSTLAAVYTIISRIPIEFYSSFYENRGFLFGIITFCIIAMIINITCSAITRKWNDAFANQIKKADDCARFLKIDNNNSLHEYIGFPVSTKSKNEGVLDKLLQKNTNNRSLFINLYMLFLWFYAIILIISICLFIKTSFLLICFDVQ